MMNTFLHRVRLNPHLQALGYVSLPFFPAFCFFILEYMNYAPYKNENGVFAAVIRSWRLHMPQHLFGLIAVSVIFFMLLLLFKKAAVAGGILGVLSCIFAYIDYMKVTLNGDHLFPRDFSMAGSTGELMKFISGKLPVWFYIAVLALILWTAAFAMLNTKLPLRLYIRLPAFLLLAAIIFLMFSDADSSAKILKKFELRFEDALLQESNYRANGFVSAFTVNLLSMNVEEPDGYSEAAVADITEDYEYTSGSGKAYDVIVVLSESFFDIRKLSGVEFSENPLPNYDRITASENCVSGTVVTTAHGGGTARPEFNILTGLSADYLPNGASPYEYVTGETKSVVSHYRDNGYKTVALHLYDKTFYSRNTAYPLLGFDEFYGLEDASLFADIEYKRGYATDKSTLAVTENILESSDEPIFLSVITIQNHQPYGETPEDKLRIRASSSILSDTGLNAVNTYTQGLYDADAFLGELTEYIDGRERPTVLLFYGDHLPTLGSASEVYNATDYYDTSKASELTMYSTPFLIYSNCGFENDVFPSKRDNTVSAYYLSSIIAAMTDFDRTPYMNLLLDMYSRVPYYNTRLELPETADTKALTRAMQYVTYYRLFGKDR